MSTARHQLAGAPGTGTTIDNMQSRMKAWLNINQVPAGQTIRGSFNISSIGDWGLGDTELAFTAPMANGNHAPVGLKDYQTTIVGNWLRLITSTQIASGCRFISYENNGALDAPIVTIAVMGTLA